MNLKRKLSIALIVAMLFSISLPVSAAENVAMNGIIVSTDTVTLSENLSTTVTAALPAGFDASALTCMVMNPNVVTVTPLGAVGNVASFQFTYTGDGMTTAVIAYTGNEAVCAAINVTCSKLVMDIPKHLGNSHDNYCEMVDYTFEDYHFPWADYQDYKYTLKFTYKCTSYEDEDFSKWGCFGYFYDAAGNVIGKVHLYSSGVSVGRVYHDECNVPYNAVRFKLEGWN